jgi:predicted RNase H-like nuclease (RuvC/YqgF family)
MGKYIKVTNPKTQESVVVLASNASFLKSQGYVVSEPSEEEIQVSFPEEGTVKRAMEAELQSALSEIEKVKTQLTELQSTNETLKAENSSLVSEIEKVKTQLTELQSTSAKSNEKKQ